MEKCGLLRLDECLEIVMMVRLFYPPGQGICKCTRDIYHEKLRNGFIKIIE
jgi:hypothetical protein